MVVREELDEFCLFEGMTDKLPEVNKLVSGWIND